MIQWWNSLDTFARVYAFIAIPSTLVLIVQTILLMIGLNDGDDGLDLTDNGITDTPGDGGSDGLALFSIRGIMALLTVGGWSGLALYALFSMVDLGIPFLKSAPLIGTAPVSFFLCYIVSRFSKPSPREAILVYFGEMDEKDTVDLKKLEGESA